MCYLTLCFQRDEKLVNCKNLQSCLQKNHKATFSFPIFRFFAIEYKLKLLLGPTKIMNNQTIKFKSATNT